MKNEIKWKIKFKKEVTWNKAWGESPERYVSIIFIISTTNIYALTPQSYVLPQTLTHWDKGKGEYAIPNIFWKTLWVSYLVIITGIRYKFLPFIAITSSTILTGEFVYQIYCTQLSYFSPGFASSL